jgi:hypothetical protein
LQQAWLEVLRKRHPGVTWVTVEARNETKESKASRGLGKESE